MKNETVLVIPCRLESTRLPNKMMKMVGDKSLINTCYDQTRKAWDGKIIIVTDGNELFLHCLKFIEKDDEVLMVHSVCSNGTERAYKALQYKEYKNVVIVQGDELLVDREALNGILDKLRTYNVVSVVRKETSKEKAKSKDCVKALLFQDRIARLIRDDMTDEDEFFEHVGFYGYNIEILKALSTAPDTPRQKGHSLELMKPIEMGIRVGSVEIKSNVFNVNTIEDLEKARELKRVQ